MAKLQPRPSANCLGLGMGMGMGMGLGRRRGTHGSCEMKVDATMPVMRCDGMGCAAMSIGSTWDGTWAKISLLTPSIWCAGATQPKRQCAPIPIVMMPVPARGLQMRCDDAMRCDAMPGATIRADYACPVWHFVDFCADILWIFPFCGKNYLLYPSYMHGMKGEFHWSK